MMALRYTLLPIFFLSINYKFFYIAFLSDNYLLFAYKVAIYSLVFIFLSLILSFSRIVNSIWLTLLYLLSLIAVYFTNTMGVEFNQQIINNTIHTSLGESIELLSLQFFLYFIIVSLLLYIIIKQVILPLRRLRIRAYFFSVFLLIIASFLTTKISEPLYKQFIRYDTPRVMPLGLIVATSEYFRTRSRNEEINKKNISSHFQHNNKDTPIISVLVIGESARADRFSINGYHRATTPLLSKNSNLISFKNASSCDTSTLSSVPCLLLRAEQEKFEFPITENSLVQIFTDRGFDTHWLTLQQEAKTIHTFCEEAKQCVDLSAMQYDTDILERFKKIVSSVQTNTLIVIHAMGSHMDYNKRVPLKNQHFKPLCEGAIENCGATLNNSYDNTIIHTDLLLSKIIESLENRYAFLLYVSDHGESLGEKYLGFARRFGHASPYNVAPSAQTNIPFIMWFSTLHEEKHQTIDSTNKEKEVSHDYIFHTMLGCSNFKGDYLKDSLNLCH